MNIDSYSSPKHYITQKIKKTNKQNKSQKTHKPTKTVSVCFPVMKAVVGKSKEMEKWILKDWIVRSNENTTSHFLGSSSTTLLR